MLCYVLCTWYITMYALGYAHVDTNVFTECMLISIHMYDAVPANVRIHH
jgi:hypothetical protein